MSDVKNPIVTITMENGAVMNGGAVPRQGSQHGGQLHLPWPTSGFYDGLIFHRVHPRLHDPGRLPRRQRHGRPRLLTSGASFPATALPAERPEAHHRRAVHGPGHAPGLRRQPVLHHGGPGAPSGRAVRRLRPGDRKAWRRPSASPRSPDRLERQAQDSRWSFSPSGWTPRAWTIRSLKSAERGESSNEDGHHHRRVLRSGTGVCPPADGRISRRLSAAG